MMICESCASAARGEDALPSRCPVCKRKISVYRDDIPRTEQRIVVHKFPNTRVRCQGSRKAPASGHDD